MDVPAAAGGERRRNSHAFSDLRHSASGWMPESLLIKVAKDFDSGLDR
jgi:hypothetical protein